MIQFDELHYVESRGEKKIKRLEKSIRKISDKNGVINGALYFIWHHILLSALTESNFKCDRRHSPNEGEQKYTQSEKRERERKREQSELESGTCMIQLYWMVHVIFCFRLYFFVVVCKSIVQYIFETRSHVNGCHSLKGQLRFQTR